MKKALFATTALVAFTGAAAAEVTISGSAEMGIYGGDRYDVTNFNTNVFGSTNTIVIATTLGGTVTATTFNTTFVSFTTTFTRHATQFWNDVDIAFTLTGESDSGLSFGANVDLDEAGNLGREEDNQGTSVWLSGSFGKLTLGDTDGALDWAITDAGSSSPGTIADDETSHAGYLGTYGDGFDFFGSARDNQVLRYEYSFDSFGIAVSYEQGANSGDGVLVEGDPDGAWAIGLKYSLDLGGSTVNLGAGYHVGDFNTGVDQKIWAISAAGSFGGGFSASIDYADFQDVGGASGVDMNHTGVGVAYSSGPITLHANYGVFDISAGPFSGNVDGWGLAAAYDLGGGLSVNLGYGDSNIDLGPAVLDALASGGFPGGNFGRSGSTWSLGMSMSF
jgi:outer membrane protein OmpU